MGPRSVAPRPGSWLGGPQAQETQPKSRASTWSPPGLARPETRRSCECGGEGATEDRGAAGGAPPENTFIRPDALQR